MMTVAQAACVVAIFACLYAAQAATLNRLSLASMALISSQQLCQRYVSWLGHHHVGAFMTVSLFSVACTSDMSTQPTTCVPDSLFKN